MRIGEPAADLAAAAALCSSLFDRALAKDWIFFGEVALSGAVRAVPQPDARLKEAEKLGFTGALSPAVSAGGTTRLTLDPAETLADLIGWIRR